jgi:hypothetical protein
MLDRSNHKIRQRERQRAYRDRLRRREFCAVVPVNDAVLNFLARNRWLHERDAHDAKRVGEAIRALLELSSRVWQNPGL